MKIRINVLDGFMNIVGSLIINLFTYSINRNLDYINIKSVRFKYRILACSMLLIPYRIQ